MLQIQKFETVEETSFKAASKINSLLDKYFTSPILLLTSGGSSFDLLSDIDESLLGTNITIGVLDERYSEDEEVNNFAQLIRTVFYQKALVNGCSFIDTRVKEGESQQELSDRFENDLINWKKEFPDGKIIISLGVGSDGHCSGIMPYPENPKLFKEIFEGEKWVVSYDAKNKNPYPLRVTTTITFLKLVDSAVSYIVGSSKEDALEVTLKEGGSIAQTPAKVIKEMKEVFLFTDIQI